MAIPVIINIPFFFQLESLSSAIFAFKYGKIILLAYRLFIPIQNALR